MDSVGPSGIALLAKLNEDSKLAESIYSQSPHSRQIKSQLAEAMRRKLTHLSLEEFDEIKDLIEDLNARSLCQMIATRTVIEQNILLSWCMDLNLPLSSLHLRSTCASIP